MFDIVIGLVEKAAKLIGGEKGEKISAAMTSLKGEAGLDPEVQKLLNEDAAGIRKLLMLEVQSEDWFVRRVRPAMLWLVVLILATHLIIIPLTQTVFLALGRETFVVVMPDVPVSVATMITTIIGVYYGARSYDKKQKLQHGG